MDATRIENIYHPLFKRHCRLKKYKVVWINHLQGFQKRIPNRKLR